MNTQIAPNWKIFIANRNFPVERSKDYLRELEKNLGGKLGVMAFFTLLQKQIVEEMIQGITKG